MCLYFSVLCVARVKREMNASLSNHRAAEREKIREMLRDAIRILCQNTVSHRTKLTVEALIGITVDDGESAMVISINELVSAAEADSHQSHRQYQNTDADTAYPDYEETTANDDTQFNGVVSYGQQYNPAVPYQAVVKKETSVISYNVAPQYNAFQQNSATSNQPADMYFAAGGPHAVNETVDYGVGRGQNRAAAGAGRVRARGRDVPNAPRQRMTGRGVPNAPRQRMTSVRSEPTVKQEYGTVKQEYGAEVPSTTTGGGGGGGRKCSLETGEVSHLTVYTCQRCGKQFNNNSSFMRHKKSHLGIVYRCDGCGKVVSRSDHLTAHRRKCPAALAQAPLD